jgi:hypothetical protein
MDFQQTADMDGLEKDERDGTGPSALARLLVCCYCAIAAYAGVLGVARLSPARAQLSDARFRYAAAPSTWAPESREFDRADTCLAEVYVILLICPLALTGALVSRRAQGRTYGSRVAYRAVAGVMFASVQVLSWQVSDQMEHYSNRFGAAMATAGAGAPPAAPAPPPVEKSFAETLTDRFHDYQKLEDPARRARAIAAVLDLVEGGRMNELSVNEFQDLRQQIARAATNFPTGDDNYPRLLAALGRLGDGASAEQIARTRPPTGATADRKRLADADALHRAIEADKVRDFQSLLKRGVDVNATGSAPYTPLHHAVARGNYMYAKELMERGADPNRPGQWEAGLTEYPLHRAVVSEAMVRLLLSHNAKVDVTDSTGATPLHRAAGAGDSSAAYNLLRAEAAVDARDRAGRTPLDVALALPPGEKRSQMCGALRGFKARTAAELGAAGGAAKAE